MPPSPALRCSPAREQRMENTHKRGHSFESGLTLRAKDDDLALFTEMQNKERDTFLLHTSDDVDDSLSKLRCFSDFKLGITIPARRESSDLLNSDMDKGDYDWLLTPPDTPLFPSLDDEEPEAPKLLPRGRPRSLPINISRSQSMSERAQRSSRSSASPHRLSPSPRSSNNFGQLQSRSSSAPCSSPPPVLRSATPSRRPFTPPNKPSSPTPIPRSSGPTIRRMSTGSNGQASSSGRRGSSPMRASRGNSASPKLQGWQLNLPGFSSDAPPNLRTSPSDRAPPLVRGLSPPHRSGKGRQSMSPIPSRRPSSSHSYERDRFSSYSKGSVVSSGDDDMDSLHSVAISSSPPPRRNGMTVTSRPVAYSKKPSRTSPSISAPKRSFESIPRKMDNRKTPSNMFRPLLSSVPATTFYGGRSNSTYRPMFSRNSSLTTSTSASSDQGASIAPDMDGGEHDQNDLAGEWERTQDIDSHEEVFSFDKLDIVEDSDHELHAKIPLSGSESFNECISNKVDAHECEDSTVNFGVSNTETAAISAYIAGNFSVIDGCEIMMICSICGKRFCLLGVNGKMDICKECTEINELVALEPLLPPNIIHDQILQSKMVNEMDTSVSELQADIPKSHRMSTGEVMGGQHEHSGKHEFNCLDNCSPLQSVTGQSEFHLSDETIESQPAESSSHCDSRSEFKQTELPTDPSLRVDNPEGAGISVLLLQRASSNKWPFVQAKVLSATNILCSEPSYVRDNSSAMKRSIGRDSVSASSSVDLGSSRQTEVHIQCQFSSRKIEMESVRSDSEAKSQCTGSHSVLSISTSGPLIHQRSIMEENFNSFAEGIEDDTSREPDLVSGDCNGSFVPVEMGAKSSTYAAEFVSGDLQDYGDSSVQNTSDLQLSHAERTHYEMSTADNLKDQGHTLCANANEDAANGRTFGEAVYNSIPDSSINTEGLNGPSFRSEISDDATNSYSGAIVESETDCDSTSEAFNEHSGAMTSEKDVHASSLESGPSDHAHGAHESSSVTVEVPKGRMSRSLTLAEATDTILFCSSIIHDIAYRAATIAMENEPAMPLEPLQPTTTSLGKSDRDQDSRMMPTPKSKKFKRKKLELQTKSPLGESGNNVIVQESTAPVDPEKIQSKAVDSAKPLKLESKCNCTVM